MAVARASSARRDISNGAGSPLSWELSKLSLKGINLTVSSMSQVIPSCTVFYYPENTPPRSLTCPLIFSTFTCYYFSLFFQFFITQGYCQVFSIVLLFASESFFVFFFSIYLPVSFLVCSFLFFSICYNFLYFFCVIHQSITTMEQT